MRADLCTEAIRLCRLVRELMQPQPPAEASGLLALMLLHDARRAARIDEAGDIVLLENQDRGKWNRRQIEEALPLVRGALVGGAGPYAVQAAIAALHCEAERPGDTDWAQIVKLYEVLERMQPSPVVALNRAAAIAIAHGPEQGLAIMNQLAARGELDSYHLLHSSRAELLRKIGSYEEAVAAYERALAVAGNDAELRFLQRRLEETRNLIWTCGASLRSDQAHVPDAEATRR